MSFTLILLATFWLVALSLVERKPTTWPLAIASIFLLLTIFMAMGFSIWTSGLYVTLVFFAIGLSSWAKFQLLGINLLWSDFVNLTGITLRTLISDFRIHTIIFTVLGITILALVPTVPSPVELPDPNWFERVAFLVVAIVVFYVSHVVLKAKYRFSRRIVKQNRAHFSAFMASIFGFGVSLQPKFQHETTAIAGYAPAQPARNALAIQPHIISVMHETTFDPRFLGLPLPAGLNAFFDRSDAVTGHLSVDIFGGTTWQSEFSFYTGIASSAFGPNSSFVFQLLRDRVKCAFPDFLAKRGYRNFLMSSDETPFASHEAFYRSIGLTNIDYPVWHLAKSDHKRWKTERDDASTYRAALNVFDAQLKHNSPIYLSVMTYANHGTHLRRRFKDDRFSEIRKEALELTGSPAYAEYCVRLADSLKARNEFMEELTVKSKSRPILIINYGDHQAGFLTDMMKVKPTDTRLKSTFYSIEGLGLDIERPEGVAADFHISYLASIAFAAAGLELDTIMATQLAYAKKDHGKLELESVGAFYSLLSRDRHINLDIAG